MKTKSLALIVVAALVLVIGGCGCSGYNGLVKQDEVVKNKWNNVQSDYQRRLDLIPNLVSTVKQSSEYERNVLVKLTEARAKAASVTVSGGASFENYQRSEAANNELVASANQVIAVIEKYPDIKTTTSFLRLQDQMEGTERRIKFSRNDFNNAVMEYNKAVRSFPSSIAASVFGFKVKEGFTADMGSSKAPEIIFTK